jgi:hypothetical protein
MEKMKAYIYWIHLPEHTNMKLEGYVGVSINPKKRFKNHKKAAIKGKHENSHLQNAFQKYGDKVIQHLIWVGEEDNCYINEEILRPEPRVGWNINKGGIKPPSQKGATFNHSEEAKKKIGKNSSKNMRRLWADLEYRKMQKRARMFYADPHFKMSQGEYTKKLWEENPSRYSKNMKRGSERTEKQKEASRLHSKKMRRKGNEKIHNDI